MDKFVHVILTPEQARTLHNMLDDMLASDDSCSNWTADGISMLATVRDESRLALEREGLALDDNSGDSLDPGKGSTWNTALRRDMEQK